MGLTIIKPSMKTWGRPLRLAFIAVFLLAIAIEFILRRDDWPFSHYGMYSEYVSGREMCRYQIQVFFDDEVQPRPALHYHFDWLVDILRDQADCGYYLQGNKEDFQNRFGLLFEREGHKLAADNRGKFQKITLSAQAVHWKSWTAENVKKPERVNELYTKEFHAD